MINLGILYSKRKPLYLISILVVVGVFVILGVRSRKQWEEVVVKVFNQQQLTIAKSIGGRLENHFTFTKENLRLYTLLHYNDIMQNPNEVLTKTGKFYVDSITILFSSGAKEIIDVTGLRKHKVLTEREKNISLYQEGIRHT